MADILRVGFIMADRFRQKGGGAGSYVKRGMSRWFWRALKSNPIILVQRKRLALIGEVWVCRTCGKHVYTFNTWSVVMHHFLQTWFLDIFWMKWKSAFWWGVVWKICPWPMASKTEGQNVSMFENLPFLVVIVIVFFQGPPKECCRWSIYGVGG